MVSQDCNGSVLELSAKSFGTLLQNQSLQVDHLLEHYFCDDNLTSVRRIIKVLCDCLGRGQKIILVGIGKSLKIAEKCAATLQSMGLASITMHPTDALHGDIGSIQSGDCVLACSSSGETEEIINLLRYLDNNDVWSVVHKIAVCRDSQSTLAQMSDECLLVPQKHKECEIQNGLPAPTVSSTSMLVVLDCLSLALSQAFRNGDLVARNKLFSTMHPGGSIGKKNQPNGVHSATVETGKIHIGMNELEILRAVTLNDWVEWESTITLPSKVIKSLYKNWASDQHTSFDRYLARKLFK
ncbi:SIS domain-containing protein TDEL_0D05750 [Torulaspora delbrueckii]|uniref:SIS domain-containing protein n=1 Tax=Torulaspora delbrueckii TaxID=4950 RepID=G8ZU65_TORDE|nr:hypothetical protein TDEL_0D05750 [Torulaspora delbrueckii]CCE92159.1 hypothetical protein TDEL_0D05750 [Torulaspora delbrueckii]